MSDVDVDTTPPVDTGRRKRFLIIIGALSVVVVILAFASIVKALRGRAARQTPTVVIVEEISTPTWTPLPPTKTPTRKPTNTQVVSKPTNTPVVKETPTAIKIVEAATSTSTPTEVPPTPTRAPTLTPTPAPAEIPDTGVGFSGILIGALALIVLIFLARRMRLGTER